MADALKNFIMKGTIPPKSLGPRAQKASNQYKKIGPTNLAHMGTAICLLLKMDGATERIKEIYEHDFNVCFRSMFEGVSVGYSSYQSLGGLAVMKCEWAPPGIRAMAREFLRWDLTLQCLCSTVHGHIFMGCGRVYTTQATGAVGNVHASYRIRAIRGISDDGAWPKQFGAGPNFWKTPDSASVWPWREDPDLPELLFSVTERAALQDWCMERRIGQTLLNLIQPIRIRQILHIAAVPDGHISWMEDLRSYAEGKNSAQPLVWWKEMNGKNPRPVNSIVRDPPTGAILTEEGFVVNGDLVQGFPMPGKPHFKFSMEAPVVTQ